MTEALVSWTPVQRIIYMVWVSRNEKHYPDDPTQTTHKREKFQKTFFWKNNSINWINQTQPKLSDDGMIVTNYQAYIKNLILGQGPVKDSVIFIFNAIRYYGNEYLIWLRHQNYMIVTFLARIHLRSSRKAVQVPSGAWDVEMKSALRFLTQRRCYARGSRLQPPPSARPVAEAPKESASELKIQQLFDSDPNDRQRNRRWR